MVRIANPVYGHTLAPNFAGEEMWGATKTKLFTNSLGFKDVRVRTVPLRSDRKRVVFIGDSFTEGASAPYEETFVGRFAAAFPELDVLNAAVSSYSPSIYYAKVKYLLDTGLQIDELIVYVDISDIQDEAIFYRLDGVDHVQEKKFDQNCQSPELIFSPPNAWSSWSYTLDFLEKSYAPRKLTATAPPSEQSNLTLAGHAYGPDRARASWTYDPQSACYGPRGIEGGIAKAIKQMDRLYALAVAHHVPVSVGVYPWPQQLLYDNEI